MNNHRKTSLKLSYALLLLLMTVASVVHAFDLAVADESGTSITGFKWTLEENLKSNVAPGVQTQDSLSLSFHNSYSPVLASGVCGLPGDPATCTIPADDPAKQYFVSVLPFTGHTLGGATFLGSETAGTVDVHTHAIPTAQITVRLFGDNHPINGAPDDPEEQTWPPIDVNTGLPTTGQFTVHLADAGGRYGATGGEIIADAFGNPLGTEYSSPGVVTTMGTGFLVPDAQGFVHIKYIPPAKYGVTVIPPTGEGWVQTSTLEGTKTIDAWVLANEPVFFAEFGPPGPHVNIGFTQEFTDPALTGPGSVSGTITNNHMARPPEVGFFSSWPFGGCWVGLNETVAAGGQSLYAAPCDADSGFNIIGIPDGTYDLVVWDKNLDIVIATRTITITLATPAVALGEVPVFDWFGRTEFRVFLDEDEDGFRDPGEQPIPEQATGFRFRNGTPYQGFATDLGGEAPYDEVFPFFHWLVAEVDFARYKATGVTYVVDNGGEVLPDNGWDMPTFDVLNPQPQLSTNPNTGNNLSTTIKGPVISLASQVYLGQTNVIEWGKAIYGMQDVDNAPYGNFPGAEDVDNNPDLVEFEYGNGGISGMALYAITRAENDPRMGAAEEWEPGIPRIQMNLYKDFTGDGIIDDADGVAGITLADTDNAPQGNFPGAEDVDRNSNGFFDFGDAIQVTYTDSWDDSLPTGCVPGLGGAFVAHPGTAIEKVTDCYDGLRNFNQLREGVYDGGYAFTSRIAREDGNGLPSEVGTPTGDEIPGLLVGYYIVESAVPDAYVLMKEEDKNVDFGDEFVVPAQLPPICVGDDHVIPEFLSFQTGSNGLSLPGIAQADLINTPFYDPNVVTMKPLCDRKQVALTAGKNAAADFFMFTQTPVAAHVVGGILNDLGNEFDPNNPNFGEKFAPSWVPVIFYDWEGKVVTKVYADEFGKYEALVPSTYTVNVASPTGMSPNMLNACMNDPGADNDPFYNPQFSTFCYVFQYMPGSTTYLDTPVVPVAAFANAGGFPLDCAIPDNHPLIKSVDGSANSGPVLPDGFANGGTLSIISEGMLEVPNHLFGAPGEPITISRNYGFGGTQGTGSVFIGNTPVIVTSWTNEQIDITVPAGVTTGQLVVTTDSGNKAPRSVTVTTHLASANIHVVSTTIQAAIDGAANGDLVLLPPGAYSELVIMDKPVQIQGYGAGVTSLSAVRNPATKLEDWRLEIAARAGAGTGTGSFDYLPNQEAAFLAEEGPGIIVLGQAAGNFTDVLQPRIDGLEISGAISGGAIFVNAYVDFLNISNNKITGNEGTFGGGIRIGNPAVTAELPGGTFHVSSDNDFINIHDNEVVFNGTTFGPAGGIGLYTGSNNYTVDHNFICGNFAQDHGAGISHLGTSDNGVISNNTIAFNQNFNQARNVHGGGLFIGGHPGLAPLETEGSGSVVVEGNLIQGNSAGAGLGGGIMLSLINGVDVANNPGDLPQDLLVDPPQPFVQWYGIDIFDNMIVNNHAGWTGAGIAMQDAAKVRIMNNTIAHNEATATVGNLFVIDTVAQTAASVPQVGAGIASFAHSTVLAANTGQTFSDPELVNDIVWENRTFSWFADITADPQFGLVAGGNSDLGVVDIAGATLDPTSSILTDATGTDVSNSSDDPGFILDYFNTGRDQTVLQIEQNANTLIGIAVALDEGGNFVDVQYGPLSIVGNYHLRTDSLAINAGTDLSSITNLLFDIDGEERALATPFDIGADEVVLALTPDTDGDGVVDTLDNCTLVPNPNQRDTDADNFGNICDADLTNDLIVNLDDFGVFRSRYLTDDPDADFNGDGIVNLDDFGTFRSMYLRAPGPSGLVN